EVVAQLTQLALANAREGERVEDHHHVLLAPVVRQLHLVEALAELEVRGLLAHLYGHARSSISPGRPPGPAVLGLTGSSVYGRSLEERAQGGVRGLELVTRHTLGRGVGQDGIARSEVRGRHAEGAEERDVRPAQLGARRHSRPVD